MASMTSVMDGCMLAIAVVKYCLLRLNHQIDCSAADWSGFWCPNVATIAGSHVDLGSMDGY